MPPEYVVRGRFSMKSDVFSYGVIVLEIISGKKNREFSHAEHSHNLLGHVNDLTLIGLVFFSSYIFTLWFSME